MIGLLEKLFDTFIAKKSDYAAFKRHSHDFLFEFLFSGVFIHNAYLS